MAVSPVSLEYSLQSAGAKPMALSVSLHHNLRLGGSHTGPESFESVRQGSKAGYSALRLGLSAAMAVAEEWQVRARLSAQWTPDALVSGEQFGLGGAQSLRGYEERELIGDMGEAAAVEIPAGEGVVRAIKDVPEALTRAGKEGRHVLVFVYHPSCGGCREFKSHVFGTKGFADFAAARPGLSGLSGLQGLSGRGG